MQILDISPPPPHPPPCFQPAEEMLWWGSAMYDLVSTSGDSDLTRIQEQLA